MFLVYRAILYDYLMLYSFHVTIYELFLLGFRIDFVFHESLFGCRRIIS